MSNLNVALEYAEQILGTPYGWWSTDYVPDGAPAWAINGSPPDPEYVKVTTCFCAGLTNLMLRSVGKNVPPIPEGGDGFDGGTRAYGTYFYDWSEGFDIGKALNGGYPPGTLIGRYFDWDRYYQNGDEGHVAVLLENGWVLQSYPGPGVNWDAYISDSHAGYYYEYAVLTGNWINY